MYKKGFTLVELLIVIAVIGILSSTVFVNLSNARQQVRDTVRKTDLKQLELALELHYANYGSYTQPEALWSDCSTGENTGSGGCPTGSDWGPSSDLRDLVTNKYIEELPIDPLNDATYRYTYEPWNAGQGGYTEAGQAYDLCAPLETEATFCINKRK